MRNPRLCPLAIRFKLGLVASWRGARLLTPHPELINHSLSYFASGHVHKGAIIENDSDDYQFCREGEAEEDARVADFVCRRVAKDHYLSPFGVFNKLNCVVLVGNIMTFLWMVLWLDTSVTY